MGERLALRRVSFAAARGKRRRGKRRRVTFARVGVHTRGICSQGNEPHATRPQLVARLRRPGAASSASLRAGVSRTNRAII